MSKCQCSKDFPEEPFAVLSGKNILKKQEHSTGYSYSIRTAISRNIEHRTSNRSTESRSSFGFSHVPCQITPNIALAYSELNFQVAAWRRALTATRDCCLLFKLPTNGAGEEPRTPFLMRNGEGSKIRRVFDTKNHAGERYKRWKGGPSGRKSCGLGEAEVWPNVPRARPRSAACFWFVCGLKPCVRETSRW